MKLNKETRKICDYTITIVATPTEVVFISGLDDPIKDYKPFIDRYYIGFKFTEESNNLIEKTFTELESYFNGELEKFTVKYKIMGTPFQTKVLEVVRSIPYGEIWSYQEIANIISAPNSVRAVASAIGANPVLILLPCHRINASNGSLAGYRSGIKFKQFLQNIEAK